MKKIIIITLMFIVFFSCEKDTSPLGKYISVHYTSKIDSVTHEFRISNDSKISGWYHGYREGSPLYWYSVLTDSGWVKRTPGWCGTGVSEINFGSGDSFFMQIYKPVKSESWRLGIHIFYDFDQDGEIFWSQEFN